MEPGISQDLTEQRKSVAAPCMAPCMPLMALDDPGTEYLGSAAVKLRQAQYNSADPHASGFALHLLVTEWSLEE